MLLKGKLGSLEDAITEATQVEYALNFETQMRHTPSDVNAVHQHQEPSHTPEGRGNQPESGWKDLCQTLKKMSARLEALEKRLQQVKTNAYFNVAASCQACYLCGEEDQQEGVSVKLQLASCSAEGERQLAGSTLNLPGNESVRDVNVLINVHGLLNDSNVQFLLDSGVAQPVVHYDALDDSQPGR